MKTLTAMILSLLSTFALADDMGLSAGQGAMMARAVSQAYATGQVQQDVVQVYQGNGHAYGSGVNLNLSIGSYNAGAYGQAPRENIVNVHDVMQICMHC